MPLDFKRKLEAWERMKGGRHHDESSSAPLNVEVVISLMKTK